MSPPRNKPGSNNSALAPRASPNSPQITAYSPGTRPSPPSLNTLRAGRYPATLGQTLSTLVDDFAKSWVKKTQKRLQRRRQQRRRPSHAFPPLLLRPPGIKSRPHRPRISAHHRSPPRNRTPPCHQRQSETRLRKPGYPVGGKFTAPHRSPEPPTRRLLIAMPHRE